jgi:uncharacterized protein
MIGEDESRRAGRGPAAVVLITAIRAYQLSLSFFLGRQCRHLPTCSEYALEAIDRNGAWRGSWLALSRVCRCHPWGTHGYDAVPDIRAAHRPLAPWRYGRWRARDLTDVSGLSGR